MLHHHQNFNETRDSCCGFSVSDVTFDGAEIETGISLGSTKSVANAANLNRIANAG